MENKINLGWKDCSIKELKQTFQKILQVLEQLSFKHQSINKNTSQVLETTSVLNVISK